MEGMSFNDVLNSNITDFMWMIAMISEELKAEAKALKRK